ncbi:hypothetical protein niasHT_031579 [Heterodera trifolii]|uniref:Uncharacterized protein n=1 Tax=Heterodera trifolii TaxID=157864 RepID=A0ABD2IXQ2_9BILA
MKKTPFSVPKLKNSKISLVILTFPILIPILPHLKTHKCQVIPILPMKPQKMRQILNPLTDCEIACLFVVLTNLIKFCSIERLNTRSGNTAEQTKGRLTSDFFKDSRRATVALSRARDGMFLIGDFRILQEGPVWQRFLTKAQEFVPIFTDEYLSQEEVVLRQTKASALIEDKGNEES